MDQPTSYICDKCDEKAFDLIVEDGLMICIKCMKAARDKLNDDIEGMFRYAYTAGSTQAHLICLHASEHNAARYISDMTHSCFWGGSALMEMRAYFRKVNPPVTKGEDNDK